MALESENSENYQKVKHYNARKLKADKTYIKYEMRKTAIVNQFTDI